MDAALPLGLAHKLISKASISYTTVEVVAAVGAKIVIHPQSDCHELERMGDIIRLDDDSQ